MFGHDLRSRSLISGAILSAVLGLASMPAHADMSLYENGGLKIDGAFAGGVTLFTSPGAQFGAGSYANVNGTRQARISGRPTWTETFLAPELKASYETENAGTFYGDVSAQFTMTGGDGEASLLSSTYGHPWLVDLENLYAGWKSGKTLTGLGLDENGLDLSGGRQSFRIADGFLISNGTNNAGKRGMWWTQSRTAFEQTGVAKLASGNMRGDVFYLQNNASNHQFLPGNYDNAKTKVLGANVELFGNVDAVQGKPAPDGASNFADRKWYVGATYFKVVGADNRGVYSFNQGQSNSTVTGTLSSNRDGMNVFSFHLGGNPVPVLPDFSIYANAVREINTNSNRRMDAGAYYIEPGYQLSDVMWTPKLSYRYVHFSGDSDPNDNKKEAYDPFFYNAITRGFGTWFIGEIVGNYIIANSNVNINQVTFSVNPRDDLKLSVLAFDYRYDQKAQAGVGSNALAREIDFAAEWAVTDNIALSAAFGMAEAGNGYKQNLIANTPGSGYPGDKTWLLGETSLVVKF